MGNLVHDTDTQKLIKTTVLQTRPTIQFRIECGIAGDKYLFFKNGIFVSVVATTLRNCTPSLVSWKNYGRQPITMRLFVVVTKVQINDSAVTQVFPLIIDPMRSMCVH